MKCEPTICRTTSNVNRDEAITRARARGAGRCRRRRSAPPKRRDVVDAADRSFDPRRSRRLVATVAGPSDAVVGSPPPSPDLARFGRSPLEDQRGECVGTERHDVRQSSAGRRSVATASPPSPSEIERNLVGIAVGDAVATERAPLVESRPRLDVVPLGDVALKARLNGRIGRRGSSSHTSRMWILRKYPSVRGTADWTSGKFTQSGRCNQVITAYPSRSAQIGRLDGATGARERGDWGDRRGSPALSLHTQWRQKSAARCPFRRTLLRRRTPRGVCPRPRGTGSSGAGSG